MYICVRANKCMLPIYIWQTYTVLRSLGEVQQLSSHMIAIMVVYFLFQEIPCRELSQLGKGKIISKVSWLGIITDWKPLAETISPLQAPPPRNQLSRCFSLKKTCFKMTQNHTETKAGFKKVNHFECSFNWNAINNQHKPTCVFPIPTSKKYPLPVFFSGADWVRV